MSALEVLSVALPVLMAVAAVGALLLIKTQRRQQAPTHGGVGVAVPVRAMSREHARRLLRRYLWGAAAIVAAVLLALGVAAQRG